MDVNTRAEHESRYPAVRFNEKGCLPVWGGHALSSSGDALKVQKSSSTNSEFVHAVPKANVTQLT